MTKNLDTQSDVIATTLARHGVEFVFGLPGGEISAFVCACRRAGMRFVLTGHESSAAIIAQVMGEITGTPGVCAATLGPGATNLVTGVANAYLDRSPLLAITAQIPASAYETMTHQRLPLNELFAPITKRSTALEGARTDELISEALALAITPRSGPVHFTLASDIAIQEALPHSAAEERSQPSQVERPANIAEILEWINASERLLVLAGLGVPVQAEPALRGLVDALQTPFVITPKAKGILREDHPHFLGVASGMALDRDVLETLRAADLILAFGFDPIEADKTWFADLKIAAIDSVSMANGKYRPLEALGSLTELIDQIAKSICPKPWPAALLNARKRAVQRAAKHWDNGISPLALIESLRAIFPENGIVTCDVGSHKLLMGQFWKAYEPGTFFMSNGLSGMGYAVPAAIAAQLARPERPVLAVVGDGGMLMMLHDLPLVRELNLPVIVVVLRDESLSLIRVSQERRGFEPCGVDFTPPNFAALACGFGLPGKKATSAAQAAASVESAIARRQPLVLEVPVDLREYYDLV